MKIGDAIIIPVGFMDMTSVTRSTNPGSGIGTNFGSIPLSGRLAEGAYLAVQIPESFQSIWDWDEWVYLPARGAVVSRDDHQSLIPYNYLVFGISRYEERGH